MTEEHPGMSRPLRVYFHVPIHIHTEMIGRIVWSGLQFLRDIATNYDYQAVFNVIIFHYKFYEVVHFFQNCHTRQNYEDKFHFVKRDWHDISASRLQNISTCFHEMTKQKWKKTCPRAAMGGEQKNKPCFLPIRADFSAYNFWHAKEVFFGVQSEI